MKRFLVIVFTPLLISSSLIHAADAASPASGGKCSKVGLTAISAGKTFTCIKSGKQLIWNKGVAIKKPLASPMPSPSPSPNVNPAPSPSPVASSNPITPAFNNLLTFQNILNNSTDVPAIAFDGVQTLLQFNQKKNIPAQPSVFKIAPGLTADVGNYQSAIKKANVFFASFQVPISYLGILYTAKDMDWAKIVFDQESGFADHDSIVKAPFGGDPNSTGGGANANTINNHGITVFGHYKGFDTDPFVTSMAMATHEYVHQIQVAQFSPNRGDQGTQANEALPCWITEGQANFNGIGISAVDFNSYMATRSIQAHSLTLRNATTSNGSSELGKSELTPEYISKYYDEMNLTSNASCIRSSKYGLGYSIGMLTIEALSAIKGPDSSMLLVQKLGAGKSFDDAFLEVYGSKWSEVKDTLAQLVSRELQSIL